MRRAVRNIFRLHLEQPQTGRKMQATVYLPTRRRMRRKDSPKLTSVWVSKYTVNRDGRKQRHEAFGEDWLQALLMAVEGVRLRLPPGEEGEWMTQDGVPAWIIFPRRASIGWGYDHWKKLVDHAEKAEAAIHKMIAKKRRGK